MLFLARICAAESTTEDDNDSGQDAAIALFFLGKNNESTEEEKRSHEVDVAIDAEEEKLPNDIDADIDTERAIQSDLEMAPAPNSEEENVDEGVEITDQTLSHSGVNQVLASSHASGTVCFWSFQVLTAHIR